MQVARDAGALLVDGGEHSQRKVTHQGAAARRLAFHQPAGDERREPSDDHFGIGGRSARVARAERDRAGVERQAHVRIGEYFVFEVAAGAYGAFFAIAPSRNHDSAAETFRHRAALAQIELRATGRRGGHDEGAGVCDRDHPLVEAGAAGDEIAEASEAFGRARAADGCNGVVKLIPRGPLAPKIAPGADGLAATLGAVSAPEFQRGARGGERELAENGSRQKFKRCFKFSAGAICPRHQRDSDGELAVDEDRRGQLVFPVYFHGRRNCVDFAQAQRNVFDRLDIRSSDCTGCDRVGESMVERGQQRVEDFVPLRISARCIDDIVGAGGA